MSTDQNSRVVDNQEQSRFEILVGGAVGGHLRYRQRPGDRLVLIHTEVDPAYEGRGLGSRLVAAVLDSARVRGLSVVPLCPFAASFIERHPEYSDLVLAGSA